MQKQPTLQPQQQQTPPLDKYRCRKCRKQLFSKIIHSNFDCSSIFIQQPQWLDINDMENEIKFNCPKCQSKLGDVIFSGKMCSCGKWITPAYQVLKNKVDCVKNLGLK